MKKILIVDDSPTIRKLIGYILKKQEYIISEAEDGIDAMEKLGSLEADLVIVDLNMPNMDGIQFVKSLRSNYYHMDIPVIMLTTESQESKKQEGKAAGAKAWVVKPFKPEQMLDAVSKLILP